MKSYKKKDRSILGRFLEKGIEIFLKKECKKINELQIKIYANTKQIIKGLIDKIELKAKNINYKELSFDEIDIEANEVKIQLSLNRELKFKNDFTINLKVKLSEDAVRRIFLSNNWSWVADMISKELLNTNKLHNIKIRNDQIELESKIDNNIISQIINIESKKGKIFLENKSNFKSIQIPIEDKMYIEKIDIDNNLVDIKANSIVSL